MTGKMIARAALAVVVPLMCGQSSFEARAQEGTASNADGVVRTLAATSAKNESLGPGIKTLRFSLPKDVQPDIAKWAASETDSLRLTLCGVKPPHDRDVYVRIFLNMPHADWHVEADDPRYVGYFTFFNSDGEPDGRTSFVLELDAAIARLAKHKLWKPEDGFVLTFLITNVADDQRARDVKIPVGRISVTHLSKRADIGAGEKP